MGAFSQQSAGLVSNDSNESEDGNVLVSEEELEEVDEPAPGRLLCVG